MTSYNYENFIPQAIESVINQTVSDWELIIVDDGSKDNSVKIINEYCKKDPRIKLLTHSGNVNKGLKDSLLLGIKEAQSEWLAFLESDDYWSENYLEEKIKMIEKYPECALIYNDVEYFGEKSKFAGFDSYFSRINNIWKDKESQDVFDLFGTENIVPTFSCVMCSKKIFLQCNLNPVCEPIFDYWLWWQMAEKSNFCFVNKKLTFWRLHKSSYLSKSLKTFRHHVERAQFVSGISKTFKRKPKLCAKYLAETNPIITIPAYILIYLKRKIPCCIKNLFVTR